MKDFQIQLFYENKFFQLLTINVFEYRHLTWKLKCYWVYYNLYITIGVHHPPVGSRCAEFWDTWAALRSSVVPVNRSMTWHRAFPSWMSEIPSISSPTSLKMEFTQDMYT